MATRDLQGTVEMGALSRTGERKHTRNLLNIAHEKNSGNLTKITMDKI